MALRSLVAKLRGAPASVVASRAFSQKCEHCGKTSSRIAHGAIKKRSSVDQIETSIWKHYMIRTTSVVTSCTFSWLVVKAGVACLEDEELFGGKK